jgi:hypothetical protein
MTYEEVDYPMMEERWEEDVMSDLNVAVTRIVEALTCDATNCHDGGLRFAIRQELLRQHANNQCDLLRMGADLGCWPSFEQWYEGNRLDAAMAAQGRALESNYEARTGREARM